MTLLALFQAADDGMFRLINRMLENPVFDRLMPILSDKWVAFALAAGLLAIVIVRGDRRAWLLVGVAIASVALSDASGNLIKHLVDRTRPCHVLPDVHLLAGCTRSFSLPSNHATNMFALAAVVWLTLHRWRWALVGLATAVAYSRVYLGVHYPSDVLVGALWGASMGWSVTHAAMHLWPGLLRRRDAEQGTGPEGA
jgi:undecaprenyl-diphosphatase